MSMLRSSEENLSSLRCESRTTTCCQSLCLKVCYRLDLKNKSFSFSSTATRFLNLVMCQLRFWCLLYVHRKYFNEIEVAASQVKS